MGETLGKYWKKYITLKFNNAASFAQLLSPSVYLFSPKFLACLFNIYVKADQSHLCIVLVENAIIAERRPQLSSI